MMVKSRLVLGVVFGQFEGAYHNILLWVKCARSIRGRILIEQVSR